VDPNATWNVSLESYHPYLQPQEVSKTPTTLGTYGSLPKIKKGHFGFLSPLGVKMFWSLSSLNESFMFFSLLYMPYPAISLGSLGSLGFGGV
jgi:hypothetical protein